MIESFYENPEITPKVYAHALIDAAIEDAGSNIVKRLLEEADEGDLRQLKGITDMQFNRRNFMLQSKEPGPEPSLVV